MPRSRLFLTQVARSPSQYGKADFKHFSKVSAPVAALSETSFQMFYVVALTTVKWGHTRKV